MVSLFRREWRPMLGFLTVAALLLVFTLVADEMMEGGTAAFDDALFRWLRPGPRSPAWLEEAARDVTALGSYPVLGIGLAVAVAGLFMAGQPHAAWLMLGSVLGGTLLSNALKVGFDRPRPAWPGAPTVFSASFPSGHAMLTATAFLTVGLLLARLTARRRMKALALGTAMALTVLVGVTRVHLGVHYASDVLAGWCVGAAWALLCWNLALWLQRRGQVEAPAG